MRLNPIAVFCMLVFTACRLFAFEAYDDFDRVDHCMPITELNGWTNAPGDIPGIITNSMSFSPDYSVELPVPPGAPGATNSSMVVTGEQVYVWSAAENPVMRFSARIYCKGTGETLSMRGGAPSGDQWVIRFDGSDGHIKLNGTDSGVSFVSGSFVEVVLYYNISNNTAALEYDGVRILDWVALGGTASTQFNHVSFHRETAGAGRIYVDSFVIETFSASTAVWWRFEEDTGHRIADHTGRIPASYSGYGGGRGWRSPAGTTVNDGYEDFHNNGEYAGAITVPSPFTVPLVMTDWTFEALIRMIPGGDNAGLICAGTGNGFASTNAMIYVSWQESGNCIICTLRSDASNSTGSFQFWNNRKVFVDDDNADHHVAIVKTGGSLVFYVDYKPIVTNALNSVSLGTYTFGTNANARVGAALNGGNTASEKHVFGEMRLSSGALNTNMFLRLSGYSAGAEGEHSESISALNLLLLGAEER